MGTPHGRTPGTPRAGTAVTPCKTRTQLIKPPPQRSFFASISGILSGITHTATRGVTNLLRSNIPTTRRRGSGAVTKPSAAHILKRRTVLGVNVRKDSELHRRMGTIALEHLRRQNDSTNDMDETDNEGDEDGDDEMENRINGENGYLTPLRNGKRAFGEEREDGNSAKRHKSTPNGIKSDDERIAELERKVAQFESQLLLAASVPISHIPVPPPPPPPPPPPLTLPSSAITNHRAALPPPQPARDPRFNTAPHELMRKLLTEMKEVKLRRTNVMRSPGGTIRTACPEQIDPNDHQQVITHALRDRFRKLRSESPEPDSSDASPSLSPMRMST
ncbi:hypothetical protein DFJ77DRAFT_446710 [Powellomyces hirtus]|nr:hypothetical protein DFJ77DRAFT_446710 [Powellomyces hirtus]